MSKEWDTVPRISMSGILETGTEFIKVDKANGCGAEINSPWAWLLFKE
jgi:hypothetical protein